MRIISDFYDYYDSLGTQDKSDNLYKRIEKVYEDQKNLISDSNILRLHEFMKHGYQVHNLKRSYFLDEYKGVVGFCGKWYPYIKVEMYEKYTPVDYYFYEHDSYKKILERLLDKKDYSRYMGLSKDYRLYYKQLNGRRQSNDKYFSFFGYYNEDLVDIFRDLKTPIVHIFCEKPLASYSGDPKHPKEIKTDVNLSELGFQKVIDPYTAAQEIEMFYFGVIGTQEKDTAVVSDRDLRDMKGFDPVYGFRTRPKN